MERETDRLDGKLQAGCFLRPDHARGVHGSFFRRRDALFRPGTAAREERTGWAGPRNGRAVAELKEDCT